MSVRRDYILRMIEQIGQFWAAVVQLAREGQHRDALQLVARTCRQSLGFDPALLETCSAEELIGLVRLGHAPQRGQAALADRLTLLALLLRGEAQSYRALGDPAREEDRARKALAAAVEAEAADPDASPLAAETVEALLPDLRERGLPVDLVGQLWRYDERAGRFARAEDWLFALLDAEGTTTDLAARGIAFYERLQTRDDDALCQGNLPREEVAAGLAELRARLGQGARAVD